MAKPNYTQGHGGLVVDRYEFQNHLNGTADRHNSNQIDVSPSVSIQGNPYSTVSSALTAISNYIISSILNGAGFTALPDGYDSYHNALVAPNAPYDNTTPSINSVLNDILTNPLNISYARVRDGGVILLKSGTYVITDTILIPPGTTILGEGFGTKIINTTPTPRPLFKIQADNKKGYGSTTDNISDPGVDSGSKSIGTRVTRFINMVISDNFVEPKFLGDASYKTPKNITANNPLISVEEGANFSCDGVRFLGRVTYSGPNINAVTSYAIQTNNAIPVITGTSISITNCFIDGVSLALETTNLGGNNDYINVVNSYIRTYGLLNANSSLAKNNCVFHLTPCNANIQSNYILGNASTVVALVFVDTLPVSPPALQSVSKMVAGNNNIAVDRTSNANNSTFKVFQFDAAILGSVGAYLTSLSHNNSFQSVFDWIIGGNLATNPQLHIDFTHLKSNVPFSFYSTANARITQDIVSGAAGNMLIGAQNSSGSSGGNLQLLAGTGTTNGSILLTGQITGDTSTNDPLRFGISVVVLTGSIVLSPAQYAAQTIQLTGTMLADTVVTFPNVAGYAKLIDNQLAGNHSLQLIASGGGGPIIPPNTKQWVYCDGINIVSARASNQILGTRNFAGSGSYNTVIDATTSATYVDTSLTGVYQLALPGDIIMINGSVGATVGAGTTGNYIVRVIDNGGTTDLGEAAFTTTSTSLVFYPIATKYVVGGASAANVTVKVVFKQTSGSGGVNTINPSSLTSMLIRPQ